MLALQVRACLGHILYVGCQSRQERVDEGTLRWGEASSTRLCAARHENPVHFGVPPTLVE